MSLRALQCNKKKKGHETSHPSSDCILYKNCLDIDSQLIAKVRLRMALSVSQTYFFLLTPGK